MPAPNQPNFDAKTWRPVVLLVDDQPIVAEAIRRMLADEQLELHVCNEATAALARAKELRPTVILQDLVMPGVDGFTLVRFLRAASETSKIPVIVLSSKDDPRDKSRAFEVGASDYLVKIPDRIELVARIRAHARSFLAQLERDEAYRALEQLKLELEAKNRELEQLSMQDGLTGIANRRYFDDFIAREWQRARRERTELSLIMIDVDYFKKYNDRYGHQAGDDCLRNVAKVLKSQVHRAADLVARYGGEEFAVVLPSTPQAGASVVAETLRAAVDTLGLEHAASGVTDHVTLSLGVATDSPDGERPFTSLVERADTALYAAKHAGRNRWSAAPR